jgi:hypothetical protein
MMQKNGAIQNIPTKYTFGSMSTMTALAFGISSPNSPQ